MAVTAHQELIRLFLDRVGWVNTIHDAQLHREMLSSGERYVLRVIEGEITADPVTAAMFVDDEYVAAIAALA